LAGAALITGGAKRIGRAIAHALARKGYDIALAYHSSAADAQQVAGEIRSTGRRCELFQCDLADTKALPAMVRSVFKALPGCNVLVNNASIFERGEFLATDEALFDRHFDTNFKAPFFLSQEFARSCKAGQIVNVLDANIVASTTSYFAYLLTKKALYDFTLLAAKALAPDIRVNGVCPGLILPPPGQDRAYLDRLALKVPLRRKGSPEAVAAAVVCLLESDYVTGQCIFVDGGQHLR